MAKLAGKPAGKRIEQPRLVAKKKSLSKRSGSKLHGGKVPKMPRIGNFVRRVEANAAVYLAGRAAERKSTNRITPCHVLLGAQNDDDIKKMLTKVKIFRDGVEQYFI